MQKDCPPRGPARTIPQQIIAPASAEPSASESTELAEVKVEDEELAEVKEEDEDLANDEAFREALASLTS